MTTPEPKQLEEIDERTLKALTEYLAVIVCEVAAAVQLARQGDYEDAASAAMNVEENASDMVDYLNLKSSEATRGT